MCTNSNLLDHNLMDILVYYSWLCIRFQVNMPQFCHEMDLLMLLPKQIYHNLKKHISKYFCLNRRKFSSLNTLLLHIIFSECNRKYSAKTENFKKKIHIFLQCFYSTPNNLNRFFRLIEKKTSFWFKILAIYILLGDFFRKALNSISNKCLHRNIII